MTRTRYHRLFALGALVAVTLTVRDHARAGAPRALADVLPSNAAATLELDDLRALARRWQGSKLKAAFARSDAAKRMERSRLYLRLERNLGAVEAATGFPITLDKLAELGGHRTMFALYDLPNTTFVVVTELTADEARASTLLGQKGKLEQREHRGVPYLVREGTRESAPLAVALVGERLIAGTDLTAFRGALVLAARAAGLTVAAPAAGQPGDPTPLGADPRYRALAAAAPTENPIAVWVSGEAIASRYFERYWVFGAGAAKGVRAAWLGLAPGDDLTVETRLHLYAEGGPRPAVVADATSRAGASDVLARTAALPAGSPFASAHPVDAAAAAGALAELLPLRADDGTDALVAALAPARPLRAVELLAPSEKEHHAALALALGAPDQLDAARLESAIAAALAPSLGGAPPAFSDGSGGGRPPAGTSSPSAQGSVARRLELPLVPAVEWSLAWRRAGDRLLVATDAATLARLDTALARPETQALLAGDAPRLYRLEVAPAAKLWQSTTRRLAHRSNWSDADHAGLYADAVGGLFTVAPDVQRVLAYGYARGPALYVEEVQYRAK